MINYGSLPINNYGSLPINKIYIGAISVDCHCNIACKDTKKISNMRTKTKIIYIFIHFCYIYNKYNQLFINLSPSPFWQTLCYIQPCFLYQMNAPLQKKLQERKLFKIFLAYLKKKQYLCKRFRELKIESRELRPATPS